MHFIEGGPCIRRGKNKINNRQQGYRKRKKEDSETSIAKELNVDNSLVEDNSTRDTSNESIQDAEIQSNDSNINENTSVDNIAVDFVEEDEDEHEKQIETEGITTTESINTIDKRSLNEWVTKMVCCNSMTYNKLVLLMLF